MNREQTENVLKLFFDQNSSKPWTKIGFPVEHQLKRYCCATTSFAAILIPENKDNYQPAVPFKPPNVSGIIPVFDKSVRVTLKAIKEAIASIPLEQVELLETCEQCEGEGNFPYGRHYYECKECRGKGALGSGRFEMKPKQEFFLNISGGLVNPNIINPIIEACDLLKAEELTLRHIKAPGIIWFEAPENILMGVATIRPIEGKKEETVTVIE